MGILIKRLIPIILLLALPLYAQAQGLKDDSLFLNRLGLNNSGLVHGNGGIDQSDNLPSYDSLTTAYFNRMDSLGITYSAATKSKFDEYIFKALRTAGLQDKVYIWYRFVTYDNLSDTTRVKWNLMPAYYICTTYDALTWTLGQGVQSNGTSSYINTGFNPTTDSTVAKRNDAGFLYYFRTDLASALCNEGSQNFAGGGWKLVPRYSNNNCYAGLNIGSTGQIGVAVANSLGLFCVTRTDSLKLYKGGLWLASVTTATIGKPDGNNMVCAINSNGVINAWDTRQVTDYLVTGGLTYTQQADLNTIIEALNDLDGIGVQ